MSNPCRNCPALELSLDNDHACDACAEFDYRSPSGDKCPECGSEKVSEVHEKDDYGHENGDITWNCDECYHEWFYNAQEEAENKYFSRFDC